MAPEAGIPLHRRGAILPNIRRLYRIIEERQGPGQVVAATTLCLGARVAQDRLGVPTATLNLQPSVFRSHVDNGTLGGLHMGPGMPKFVKRAVFWAIDTLYVERHVGQPLNRFRSEVGLPCVSGVFASYIHSPQLVLGLFPEWFAPVQPDWPRNTHLTGFILEDAGGEEEAHAQAERFLESGPAPILVTPGSAATDRARFLAYLVEACREVGARAMLVTNHPAQLPRTLPPGIQAFPYLPFSRVMPRCAVAVHHGGIGTLAQAVRAGVPQLIVANAHDQPDNGQRIERLGLGRTLDEHRLSTRAATRALAALVGSEETRRRCREFAPRIDARASCLAACSRIEALG